jgi:hypothetical protein
MTTYNGWTNRETWAVNLWYDDFTAEAEECLDNALSFHGDIDSAREDAISTLAEGIERAVRDTCGVAELPTTGLLADIIGADPLASVNWEEIARHYIEDIQVYCYGWNMPGYMPDSDPSMTLKRENAIDALIESMELTAEAYEQDFDAEAHKAELARVGQVSFGAYVYWVTGA